MILNKYSFGVGDRFAHEGNAQLAAFLMAREHNVHITPVWNKSHREHKTVGSDPPSVRQQADAAVKELKWDANYLVDADHINLSNVDGFLSSSDFFTIDVAQFINKPIELLEKTKFIEFVSDYTERLSIPEIDRDFVVSQDELEGICDTFLYAIQQASKIHTYILSKKKGREFITEISMDEVEEPQSPMQLFFILAALAYYKVPVQTLAPKFTGRFNKGVDYEGNLDQFKKEFEEDLLVIKYAIAEFGLPKELKLSVHTGSDKFSLYPSIRRLIQKHDCGLHLKTAGTTWLEELIGMAQSGDESLELAKDIYKEALARYDELTEPYSTVLSIDRSRLPSASEVTPWSSEEYAQALIHDQKNKHYNPHFRQLLHTAYKIAAEHSDDFKKALEASREDIERNVTHNIFERHIKPLFLG